ncbi:MAG: MMPL family transporter [Cyclobacteriaceae bacterium]
MWNWLAHIILRFRIPLIILLIGITAFMGYQAKYIQWSFDLANIVPSTDPEMIYFQEFKKDFGEDGNILALGLKDSAVYEAENFRKFNYLVEEIASLPGVNGVLGLPNLKVLSKNTELKKFELVKVFPEIPADQEELDSLLAAAYNLKFYAGQLLNENNGATLVLVTISKDILNSVARNTLVDDVIFAAEAFSKNTGIKLHYAGLPYTRSIMTTKVKKELNMFLMLSVAVTGLILFLFFRAFNAVLVPMVIIGVIVVWVMGALALFGYKITILTGLIPPIIVVIGIPNAVYMLNKYHQEYQANGDQLQALRRIIRKIGIVTFITNFTTAVGFLVLASTNITILKEFGIVAGINILATFFVSIILIPSFYSFLPPPKERHLKHLDFMPLDKVLSWLDVVVHKHPYYIFSTTGTIIIIAAFGLTKITSVSYMVDDLPENSNVKTDLTFFEDNFSGVMPLEVVIDTGVKKGVQNLRNLRKINEFELFLDSLENISQPVSVVSFVKAARQAFYNQKPAYYELPNSRDQAFILRYLSEDADQDNIATSFVDSTGQKLRMSLKIADIGSNRMDSLINEVIKPRMDEIFADSKMEVRLTGTTLMFIKGNKFLIRNLIQSMAIAFVIIAIIMAMLFGNFTMIVISLIPNMIPLLITAGIMGYFNIPLKPSTALVFSITFGISVDDSIHFLAKYRQELYANNFFVPIAISKSIRETGASMIYTSIILFFGFVIFGASEFGGTVALGTLTSITLLVAMTTNLTLLPALLIRFDSGKRSGKNHPLIEQYADYDEEEDEEIDLERIKVSEDSKK